MLRRLYIFIKTIIDGWSDHTVAREAACIAFYTIFSLAPTLVVGVFVAGLVIGEGDAKVTIIQEVQNLAGEEGAAVVRTILDNVTSIKKGVIASSLSLLILLYGASKVFMELRFALNKIFEVRHQHVKQKVMSLIKGRLLGVALVMGVGFFLLVSLTISAMLHVVSQWFSDAVPFNINIVGAINFSFSIFILTVIFVLILKILPERRLPVKFLWLGSFVSALLFSIGKGAIGFYLGSSSVSSAYGAAGSAIIFLIWIYFSVQVLLLGGEIARAQWKVYGKSK